MEVFLVVVAVGVVLLAIKFAFSAGKAFERRIPTPVTAPNTIERSKRFAMLFPHYDYIEIHSYVGSRNAAQLADMATAFENVVHGIENVGVDTRETLFRLLREANQGPWPAAEKELLRLSAGELRSLVYALRNL